MAANTDKPSMERKSSFWSWLWPLAGLLFPLGLSLGSVWSQGQPTAVHLTDLWSGFSDLNIYLKGLGYYFFAQAILFLIVEPIYCEYLRAGKKKLYIRDVAEDTLASGISQFVEYFILSRYSIFGYKNSPRANLRLLSSAMQTFLVACLVGISLGLLRIYNFVGADTSNGWNLYWGLGGFLIASFVIERKNLHEKWSYLAGLRTKVLETDIGPKRDVLEMSLTIDLIDMEMWAHNSFAWIVDKNLAISLSEYKGEFPLRINRMKYAKDAMLEKSVDKHYAYKALKVRQGHLLEAHQISDRIPKIS